MNFEFEREGILYRVDHGIQNIADNRAKNRYLVSKPPSHQPIAVIERSHDNKRLQVSYSDTEVYDEIEKESILLESNLNRCVDFVHSRLSTIKRARRKYQIQTQSGKVLDLEDPQPEDICISDIAAGLSKICRFGGQINTFYSVAQHSLFCHDQARRPYDKFAMLMHDASEAYLGDVPSPLKALLPDYREIEARLQKVICDKYGIIAMPHNAKSIDEYALVREVISFCHNPLSAEYWQDLIKNSKDHYFDHNTLLDPIVPFPNTRVSETVFLHTAQRYINNEQ